MSAATGAATKKRKKTDAKPQSQINKCLNEKRRREQENIYIEELAELISASFADMSSLSVKPDKCAILQETVNQIRHIKQQEEGCGGDAAVQQGEVSSSNPTVLRNEVFAPLLLEALNGFLFVVNPEGKIEFVTENVQQFVKYTRDELLGASIYNIIHHGDHAKFSASLLPMSVGWSSDPHPQNNRRTLSCRLLIKPPDDQEETMEEKQQRISKYENMHIQCTQVQLNREKGDSDDVTSESSEVGLSLMCIARRIPHNEKSIGTPIEQFTMKLDTSGKIIGIDTIGVSSTYSQYLNKDLMGQLIQELCHQQDLHKLSSHLKEALTTGQSTSAIYRLRVGMPEKFVHVQTKSKLFKANASMSQEPDFIMATHSIIGDNEVEGMASSPHSVVSLGQQSSSSTNSSSSTGVGGPLMSGGGRSAFTSSSTENNTITLNNASSSYASFSLNPSELSLAGYEDFFPSSTWDMGGDGLERPDSRQSLTPVSTPTPRPPSVPGYSPAGGICPSPINPYSAATQPSPAAAAPFANNFPFSPLQEQSANVSFLDEPGTKDIKEEQVVTNGETNSSERLRNLLTNNNNNSSKRCDDNDDSEARNKHRILKGLLNQDEEEEEENSISRPSSRTMSGRIPSNELQQHNKMPPTNNNMLLKLLNEKSDDDDVESRAGLKKQNELLQQLLKEQDEDRKPISIDSQQHPEDSLLKSLGFQNSTPSPPSASDSLTVGSLIGGRKRSSDDSEPSGPNKRMDSSHPVSSTGSSKLWEKNKMLASLLAKQPSKPSTIPPVPTSVISATPQDKLPKIIDRIKAPAWSGGNIQSPGRPPAPNPGAAVVRPQQRHPGTQFLNQILSQHQDALPNVLHNAQLQKQLQQRIQDVNNDHTNIYDSQSSDPVLSDILDQVIDIVPDADSSTIINLLDAMDETPQNQTQSFQQTQLNEKMAINAIQKSLMLCESAVKSPASPISLPATPPAYNSTTMSTNQQQGFPPPPVYPTQQRGRFNLQQQQQQQQQMTGRSPGPQFITSAQLTPQQQAMLVQRKLIQEQQKQQKQRLLQQQQQQQLLIPSNATADQMTQAGLQNIDNILNNSVAPNVSLQRSSSVPESQLSPGYNNSQISPGGQRQQQQQQPYSPLGQQQNFNTYVNSNQGGQARLSPSGQLNFQAQLSPRITQGQQAGYASMSPSAQGQQPTWSQQQQQQQQQQVTNRLSLQQQQNPMLNAQLTGGYSNVSAGAGRFPVQRQGQQTGQQLRTLQSPGPRQSPYPPEVFPPPASPTAAAYQTQNQGQYQQMRLQRAVSAPSAPPGGMGSPRHYGLSKEMTHPMSPHNYHHHHHIPPPDTTHTHQMIYHHPPPDMFSYDQSGWASSDRRGGGVNNNNTMTSEYVRQELRAVVGARTQQPPQQQQAASPRQQQQSIQHVQLNTGSGQQVSAADLDALGLSFEMAPGPSESPKLWANFGSEMSVTSPQPGLSNRTTMEALQRTSAESGKSSLLQKLLSE